MLPTKLFTGEENSGNFKVLPCDFLILNGSCVVNESILTGESIPLIKDSIVNMDENELLDAKKTHKNNVLYSGTEVL
jgi:cation-transporting ATPase 13A1